MTKSLNGSLVRLKKSWPWLSYFLIFAIGFIILLYVLIPPGILCPDSFYHTKMALMIQEEGLIQNFPWTQFTTYKELFVDHHFGYHWLLSPFLKLPTPANLDALSAEIDPLIKAKLATAFFGALALLAIYWFLRRMKTRKPMLWALSSLLVASFLTRLSLIRAPALSVAILILGFYFILRKKYWALFILSFFYVWIYGAWPLILITVFIYCLAEAIRLTINNRRFTILSFLKYFLSKNNLKLIFSCALGLTAGLIINPYFPKTLPFYWFQTVKIAILNYHSKIGVGIEWYPPDLAGFYVNILPVLIPWVIAIAWFATSIKRQKSKTWFFLFLSAFFFLYSLKSRRNVEYFIPPAIFLSATVFSQIEKKINWLKIKNQLNQLVRGSENIFYFLATALFVALAGFFLVFYLHYSIDRVHQSYTRGRPLNHLQMASHWLKENAQPGEIIFQSHWDIFPEVFYFNSQNYYINGLDQTFMYEKDKDLYQVWSDLVFNKTNPTQTAKILKEKFNASYVLLDKNHKKFAQLLKKSKSLEKTFEDEQAIVYKINFKK